MTGMFPDFLDSDADTVARRLLGCLLVRDIDGFRVTTRIVETEAYDQLDPASHTFHGKSERNRAMFGPAGHAYIYLIYGMHYCMNVTAFEDGFGAGALIRAVEPVSAVEIADLSVGNVGTLGSVARVATDAAKIDGDVSSRLRARDAGAVGGVETVKGAVAERINGGVGDDSSVEAEAEAKGAAGADMVVGSEGKAAANDVATLTGIGVGAYGVAGDEADADVHAHADIDALRNIESFVARRRPGRRARDCFNGPAKLCKTLGIDMALYDHDLREPPLRLESAPLRPGERIKSTERIGITKAKDRPRRFVIAGSPYLSR